MADKELEQQKKQSIAAIKQASSEAVKDFKSTAKESLSSVKDQTKADLKKIKQASKDAQADIDDAVKSFQADIDLEKKLLVDDINDARVDISNEAEQSSKSIKDVIDNVKQELEKGSEELSTTVEESVKDIEELAKNVDENINDKIKEFDKKLAAQEKKNEKESTTKRKTETLSADVLQSILNEVVIIRKLVQGKSKQKTSGGQQQNSFFDRMKSMFAKKKKPQARDAQGRFTKVAEEVKAAESPDWLARAGDIVTRIGKILDIVKAAAVPMMSALLPALAIAGAIGAAIQIAKDFRDKQDKRNTLRQLEDIPQDQRTPEQQRQIQQLNEQSVYRTPGEAMRAARRAQFARMDQNPAYNEQPSAPTPVAAPQPVAPTPVPTSVSAEEKKAVDFMKRQAGVGVTPDGKFIDVWQRNAPLTEEQAKIRITDAGGDFNALMKAVKKTPQATERPAPAPAAAAPVQQTTPTAQPAQMASTPAASAPSESASTSANESYSPAAPAIVPPVPSTGENIAVASRAVEQAQEQQPQISVDAVSTESSAEVKRPLLPEAVPQIYGDRDGFAKFEVFNYSQALTLNQQ